MKSGNREIKDVVADIYKEFHNTHTPDRYPALFNRYRQLERDGHTKHELGHFAILYTTLRMNPKVMIVGNNPSWFDQYDPSRALDIVKEMERGIPTVNSYLDHKHAFARQMQAGFSQVGRDDLLESCVGMNRLWVQTGSAGVPKMVTREERSQWREIKNWCEAGTREMVRLIKPELVLLVGVPAQNTLNRHFRKENSEIHFAEVRHPSHGGAQEFASQLKDAIRVTGI